MNYIGEIAALLTAFLWAGTSIAFTEASIRVGSITVNITRMILATIFLGITMFVFGLDFSVTSNQFVFLTLSGIVGLVFGDGFLFSAFQAIGARLSMMLMSAVPAISTFFAYLIFGETISIIGLIGITITMCGILVVIMQGNKSDSSNNGIKKIGYLYGLLGALGQAGGLIFAKFAFDEGELHSITATFIRIITALIILLPIARIFFKLKNPFTIFKNDLKALKLTVVGSVLGPYLGITFSLVAIANTKLGIASTVIATVPIVMLPIVRIYYKEKLSAKSIIGAFLAVAGVALLFLE